MIVYEVTATVEEHFVEAFVEYMRDKHIGEVVATGQFTGASFERSAADRFRTRYFAPDRASLDRYLKEFAPRLRSDFVDHFPTGVDLAREEWDVIETFA